MELYTYTVKTPIGSFQRIGAELDGKIADLTLNVSPTPEKTMRRVYMNSLHFSFSLT